MSWSLLFGLVFVLGLALLAAVSRRKELAHMRRSVQEREHAVRHGAEAQLQHPVIDLSRCLGCATCVAVCPEEGVLELVHGQAMVVNGARCVGVAACERECPVGAVTVTLGAIESRRDIPAVGADLEAVGAPGLFLAGEVTAHALIKTAIEHGTAVGAEVSRRVRKSGAKANGVLDLCIVGAGPAGLACSLESKRQGLSYVTLDQESGLGGTVAKYPRRKLVLTQPVDMPLHGRLKKATYTKEELMELWHGIAASHALEIRSGEVFDGLERDADGSFVVSTKTGSYRARNVCLALGRRGSPNRLGVEGEDLPNVAYSLIDAQSFTGRRILVVGGGDTAVEAALALSEQPNNSVVLSYRKESFFRIRARNQARLDESLAQDKLAVLLGSEVRAIRADAVDLTIRNGTGVQSRTLPNDDVFVMAGGLPPVELLERSGVSFDPALHPPTRAIGEQGTGLTKALGAGLILTLGALAWALWHSDYYALPAAERPVHGKHYLLRPGMAVGLWLGIAAVALIVLNLLYLVRRWPNNGFRFGSLRLWMTSHVATGILALLCATLHAAMAPGDTAGGHAYWALAVLLVTGAIGRYFYAYVPRAANGRELELSEVKQKLARAGGETREITNLIETRQWKGSFLGRVFALLGFHRDLRRALHRLSEHGQREGIAPDKIRETVLLARHAHRTALMAAHYEDLRSVLGSWRYLHRWVAVLMVLLVAAHVVHALVYGASLDGGMGG